MSDKYGRIFLLALGLALAVFPGLTTAQEEDIEDCHDYPMLARMKGFIISDCEHNFDAVEFYVGDDRTETVEGRKTVIDYSLEEDADPPSSLQIRRYYGDALNKLNGQWLYESDDYASFKIVKDGREIWVQVEVYNAGNDYTLTVLEKENADHR